MFTYPTPNDGYPAHPIVQKSADRKFPVTGDALPGCFGLNSLLMSLKASGSCHRWLCVRMGDRMDPTLILTFDGHLLRSSFHIRRNHHWWIKAVDRNQRQRVTS